MDAAATSFESSGYRVDWSARQIYGYPFRLDLVIKSARVRERSGWALAAPRLEAEAFAFAPDHWIAVAPNGIVLRRRLGGPVAVGARVLRATLSDMDANPPRISVEGLELTFATPAGAAPFGLASAAELHMHSRAGPRGQGAAYMEIDRGVTTGPGFLSGVAAGSPITLIADGIFSQADALAGVGFGGALRNWAAAGGALTVRRLSLQAGGTNLDARSGSLGIAPDGRLAGTLAVNSNGVPRLLGVLAAAEPWRPRRRRQPRLSSGRGRSRTQEPSTFISKSARTTLGPVAIGPITADLLTEDALGISVSLTARGDRRHRPPHDPEVFTSHAPSGDSRHHAL